MTEQTTEATQEQPQTQLSQQIVDQLRQLPLLAKKNQILEAEINGHRHEKAEMALYIEDQGQQIQELREQNAALTAEQDSNESKGE
ncbi:hypothetical protein VCR15J2_390075 [Vibrio coralliirubri]|uniref:hypothetical protein n=1 Tax=Vibrio coralliirubri TaxID=1516159 RepID=UPI0006309EDD|nr:hypothetical protein [Vibrio coralliirubri]CDT53460.1 hypothetical protein VCR15J2_390075 [Vibrio coralliirubri]